MALRSALINVMIRAAEKAGRILLRDFGEVEQLQVSRKGPRDFVTSADTKAEQILMEELGRARPEFGFWAEESGKSNAERTDRFIIDPLDGTLNFMHGVPYWSISIAAERDGDIIAGIVYEPVTDQMFWAEKGIGAFVNHQRLRVSARPTFSEALISYGCAPSQNAVAGKDEKINALAGQVAGIRRMGSTALNLAYLAAGRFDGLVTMNMKPWDVAAGVLMVREAGGLVSSLAGDQNPIFADALLASNYHLNQQLLKTLS